MEYAFSNSAKLIFSDPGKYGFNLSEDDYYPPLEFDRIRIDCPQDTPIRIIAQAANTYFKTIKDLNPEIRGYHLPEGSHELLIPNNASENFQVRYQPLLKYWLAKRDGRTYEKEGNLLPAIANPNQPIHSNDLKKDGIIKNASFTSTTRNGYYRGNTAKRSLTPARKILAIQPVTSDNDLAFLYFENQSVLPVLRNFTPDAVYLFQWLQPVTGEWMERMLIKADEHGTLRIPDFPEADRPFNDWAAKIIAKKKSP